MGYNIMIKYIVNSFKAAYLVHKVYTNQVLYMWSYLYRSCSGKFSIGLQFTSIKLNLRRNAVSIETINIIGIFYKQSIRSTIIEYTNFQSYILQIVRVKLSSVSQNHVFHTMMKQQHIKY